MPSSYTTNLRFTLQATGENLNSWGNILNSGAFSLIDTAIAGRYNTTSSAVTLTTAQGAADQARNAILDVTGGSGTTFTAPSVSKLYFVRNASSGDVVVTTGGGTTATVKAGERLPVMSDGANFYRFRLLDMQGEQLSNLATPTTNNAAATKAYVDAQAFAETNLPGITAGTVYQTVSNDGSAALWKRTLPVSSASTTGQVLKSTGVDGYPEDTSQWAWDAWQGYQSKSATYTVALTDRGSVILASNTITLNLTSAATLGNKFYCRLINVGSGLVTIDPASTETITVAGGSAKTTIVLIAGEGVDIFSDGSNWLAVMAQSAGAAAHLIAEENSAPAYSDGNWVNRVVSSLRYNALGASYSAGALTSVPAGDYEVRFTVGGSLAGSIVGRIYNNTTASELVLGIVNNAPAYNPSTGAGNQSFGEGRFTLSAASSISLQSRGSLNTADGATWALAGSSPFNIGASVWLTRVRP